MIAVPVPPVPDGSEGLVACTVEPCRGSPVPSRFRGVLQEMRDDPDALIVTAATRIDDLPEGQYGTGVELLLVEDLCPDPEVRRGLEGHPIRADRHDVLIILVVLLLEVHEGLVVQITEGPVHAVHERLE